MKHEIEKWKASMARIRACNRVEVHELLKHQRTLAKVVDRIKESSFCSKDKVIRWYEDCQEEAKRCGSFSEKDAEEYIAGIQGDDRNISGGGATDGGPQEQQADEDEVTKISSGDGSKPSKGTKEESLVFSPSAETSHTVTVHTSKGSKPGSHCDRMHTLDCKDHEDDKTERTMSSSIDDPLRPIEPLLPPSPLNGDETGGPTPLSSSSTKSTKGKAVPPSTFPSRPVPAETLCGCVVM
jgi:hypothetical protein